MNGCRYEHEDRQCHHPDAVKDTEHTSLCLEGPCIMQQPDIEPIMSRFKEIKARCAEGQLIWHSEVEELIEEIERMKMLLDAAAAGQETMQKQWVADVAERDAAVAAIDKMAEYIVTLGGVDINLCDEIPDELHLKHQGNMDGNYANGPCIKCVAEYFTLMGERREPEGMKE